jgi:chromosome segregation ATPase
LLDFVLRCLKTKSSVLTGNLSVNFPYSAHVTFTYECILGQEERIEELRDTHRLESQSQSEQVIRLRKQVEEAEAVLKASQIVENKRKDESETAALQVEKLKAETERLKTIAAQEEEKRAKAIALLKTVRQKLVKTEKERDDTIKEVNDLKEKDKVERAKEKAERQRLQQEIELENLDRGKAVAGLKAQFDKELSTLKDRQEKDISALKSQFELEIAARQVTNSIFLLLVIDRLI